MVLGLRRFDVSCHDYTCTVDEDIKASELICDGRFQVEQRVIVCKITLASKSLGRVLFSDCVHCRQVTANHDDFGTIVQVPESKTASNSTGSSSDKHDFLQEVPLILLGMTSSQGLTSGLATSGIEPCVGGTIELLIAAIRWLLRSLVTTRALLLDLRFRLELTQQLLLPVSIIRLVSPLGCRRLI